MLLAAALKSLPAMPMGEALAAISRCGLHGVEIEAGTLLTSRGDLSDLNRHNLRITALDATALEPFETWIEALSPAMQHSCDIVIVSAGDDGGDAALRQRLYEQHRRAADLVGEHGLILAFDTLPGLCGHTREMLRTIEDLQHPAIRLNFDTGRYLQQNPWSSGEGALQRIFGHLASVRLTNFTVGVQPQEFPPLGQGGDVDCSRMLQILGGLEFTGPCTIAFQPTVRSPATATQCEAWLWQSVEHLRGCGWFD